MKPVDLRILAVNGGSSSIKFALFEVGDPLQRIFQGAIEGIGRPGSALHVKGPNSSDNLSRPLVASDHPAAISALIGWLEERVGRQGLAAVGHRLAHGGPSYSEPGAITSEIEARYAALRQESA